ADRLGQVLPFELVRVWLRLREGPDEIAFVVDVVALINPAQGGSVADRGDDGRAFGSVGIAGELLVAARDVAAFHEKLGAVSERVFDGVDVEVLVDELAAEVPAAGALGLDRPAVFHPAASGDGGDE